MGCGDQSVLCALALPYITFISNNQRANFANMPTFLGSPLLAAILGLCTSLGLSLYICTRKFCLWVVVTIPSNFVNLKYGENRGLVLATKR